jgi:hypothetical protein
MFLATINKPQQLLYFCYAGHVTVEEARQVQKDVISLLTELDKGFRVVSDLERLDSIEPGCAAVIGEVMELCDRKGVDLVIRVIPDPTKDIGLNILSHFHYRHHPRVATCANMAEAAKALAI